jgi:DNA primase
VNILELITKESGYRFRRETAKEYGGPCPFCQMGEDRFNIWPETGRYWCRQCGKSGDAIQFMREYRQMTFRDAVAYLEQVGVSTASNRRDVDVQPVKDVSIQTVSLPNEQWRERGWDFVMDCQRRLMEVNENPRARQWLNDQRGLTDETLWQYGIGYWPENQYEDQHKWGLDDRAKPVWLPKGIVIPWTSNDQLGGIRTRRPVGQPKYYWIPGGTGASLYGADLLTPERPAVLVEGEFDALTIRQNASDLVVAVATGSTMGARRVKWLARLALAPHVLVAFDADSAGEQASSYWLDALNNARRWRPYWDDANSLACDGADVRAWIQQGLSHYASNAENRDIADPLSS